MQHGGTRTEAELIELLRAGTIEENAALKTLYHTHYPAVAGYVLRNNGDSASARDVFQEGMIVLYRNIKERKFNGESSIGTYLYSICRFLWLKSLRKRVLPAVGQGRAAIDDAGSETTFETPLSFLIDDEQRKGLLALFDKLGDACKQMLLLSFYEDLDMREIAARTGFKDEQNARNKKHKCLTALREIVAGDKELSRTLRELREHPAP